MKALSILETIGATPHIRYQRLFKGASQQVWIKSERANPGGSIKDRIALSMVEDAEKSGALQPGGTIVEPTSGNTRVGLAMVAAGKGYMLVLVRREDCTLAQTTSWDTLGMRGTCSPGFRLASTGDEQQILPAAFADISAQTMVPYSHILWASLWWGIAAGAVAKAAQFVRGQARQNPGTVPPTASRLAEVSVQLQTLKQNWVAAARDFDDLGEGFGAREELLSMAWALRLNNLKIACSEEAPEIVQRALKIVGILGYKNDSPFSLGRHLRDALSGALMISNDRIAAKNASMLLVHKEAA